jgi:hypothetical protein
MLCEEKIGGKEGQNANSSCFSKCKYLVPSVFWGPWTPNRLKSTGRVPVLDVRFAISRQAVRNIRNGKNE